MCEVRHFFAKKDKKKKLKKEQRKKGLQIGLPHLSCPANFVCERVHVTSANIVEF